MELLSYLLNEGQADAFARELYPGLEPAWDDALSPDREAALWEQLKGDLENSDGALHARVMFGDDASGIPVWTGYTLGFHIVRACLRANPKLRAADLIGREAEEILAKSGYDGVA